MCFYYLFNSVVRAVSERNTEGDTTVIWLTVVVVDFTLLQTVRHTRRYNQTETDNCRMHRNGDSVVTGSPGLSVTGVWAAPADRASDQVAACSACSAPQFWDQYARTTSQSRWRI